MKRKHVLPMGLLAAVALLAFACSPAEGTAKKKKRDGGVGMVAPEGEYDEEEWPYDGEDEGADAGGHAAVDAGGAIVIDAGIPDVAPPPNAAPTSIVYSAPLPIGLDHRAIVTASFDPQNGLAGYKWSDAEAPLRGTMKLADVASTASSANNDASFLSWGRWLSGESEGAFYGQKIKLTGFQGFHYVVGSAATNMPTSGDVSYAAFPKGGTLATADDASLGFPTLQKAEATVRFADEQSHVGFSVAIETRDGVYVIKTTGGVSDPAQSEITTFSGLNDAHVFGGYAPATGAGPACSGSCAALVRGFLSGDAAKGMAVAYVIGDGPSAIRGAIALRK